MVASLMCMPFKRSVVELDELEPLLSVPEPTVLGDESVEGGLVVSSKLARCTPEPKGSVLGATAACTTVELGAGAASTSCDQPLILGPAFDASGLPCRLEMSTGVSAG